MSSFNQKFNAALKANSLPDSLLLAENDSSFESLVRLLAEKNRVMNLTAITEEDEIIVKHLIDSLTAAPCLPTGASVLDVGSGAGFPSLPLALARPDLRITALDATEKKIRYIQETAKALQISSLDTLSARAEAAARLKNLRGSFDCVISRAVASLPVLLELCIPFLKEGGTLIAMKGAKADQEMDASAHAMEVLGCKMAETKHFQLVSPFDNSYEERCLIVIRCLRPAPPEYPRDFAAIKKKPL